MNRHVASAALLLAVLAATRLIAAPAAADPNTKEGKIVSVSTGKLVLQEAPGSQSTLTVADSVVVSINGKVSKLEDLKKGVQVRVKTNTAGDVISITTMDGPNK
jgi:outer membrane receptor for ferrienterochelin and colicin